MTQSFGMIEVALKEVLEREVSGATGNVGGDLSYDGIDDFYVYVGLVPGAGSTDQVFGQWAVDVDVFAVSYQSAMRKALEIEAAIVGRRHVANEMRIDRVTENAAPSERPWDADDVFRIGATYVLTARRTG